MFGLFSSSPELTPAEDALVATIREKIGDAGAKETERLLNEGTIAVSTDGIVSMDGTRRFLVGGEEITQVNVPQAEVIETEEISPNITNIRTEVREDAQQVAPEKNPNHKSIEEDSNLEQDPIPVNITITKKSLPLCDASERYFVEAFQRDSDDEYSNMTLYKSPNGKEYWVKEDTNFYSTATDPETGEIFHYTVDKNGNIELTPAHEEGNKNKQRTFDRNNLSPEQQKFIEENTNINMDNYSEEAQAVSHVETRKAQPTQKKPSLFSRLFGSPTPPPSNTSQDTHEESSADQYHTPESSEIPLSPAEIDKIQDFHSDDGVETSDLYGMTQKEVEKYLETLDTISYYDQNK